MYNDSDFREIYQKFQPKIVPYLCRLLGNQDAEDIAQEVFAKVSRGLEGFKGQSKSTGFCFYEAEFR